jgi:UDP-N-acetylglucosamine/UDP-N-acetylgalactosamine diphosphorylase
MPGTDERYRNCLVNLRPRGQDHVLRWWDGLASGERERLLDDLESIPWDVLDKLIPTHVLSQPNTALVGELLPAPIYPRIPGPDQQTLYEEAVRVGRERIAGGKVAALTVAGGQGTRLGFAGPKGAVPVTPVGGKTLFQLFAETVLAAGRRYGVSIPWYVMTSPANHYETVDFLVRHHFFGLPRRDVIVFQQGMLPAFDFAGRLLLEDKHRLALAPDGHGGVLKALLRSGALADMQARGVEVISYFQVDNPLVKPFDPLFIGLHALTQSEMSTKVARKADDLERVGNLCLRDGRLTVIEYSEFPEIHARVQNADGRRRFDAGNLAMHLLDVGFVQRITSRSFELPCRRAEKVVPFINDDGSLVSPSTPNAIKLETFIFDALPSATNPLALEVDRTEEFSPVKNLTGVDSLESAKHDQIRRACRWLEAAGVKVPRDPNGEPDVTVEISPLFALDAEELATKKDQIPALKSAATVYLQ